MAPILGRDANPEARRPMLHHVSLEVSPAELERSIEFWELLGFSQVEPPGGLGPMFTWLEREGTQIHLRRTESPTVPGTATRRWSHPLSSRR
jgi:catechol 2,3-dioxygenase-like lactoylglutathione lyase family enzyme